VPSLLIEKVIEDATELASDLKCFVFSGQTRFIQHVDSRFTADKRDTFYRRVLQDSGVQRWERMSLTLKGSIPSTGPPLSDTVLERARGLCERAGEGLEMARVDLLLSTEVHLAPPLYQIPRSKDSPPYLLPRVSWPPKGALYLGEMTPYPGGGKHAWQGDLDGQLGRAWCENGGGS
jgi:hypothetical protein